MKGRRRTAAASALALLCCIALIITGAFALFTDRATINNHLEAGSLNVRLLRIGHYNLVPDERGYLREERVDEGGEEVDFTHSTRENSFGLGSGDVIVPTSELSATFKIVNDGIVAFNYRVEIVFTDKDGNLKQAAEGELYSQLDIGVLGNTDGEKGVGAGESDIFTVFVKFKDDKRNNDVQGKSAYFDVIVHVAQV